LPRMILAYHRSPEPWSRKLVEAIAERLDSGAFAAELEAAPRVCSRGDVIVALLPARGGHLEELRYLAGLRGCRVVGPIPHGIVGGYAARSFRRAGCQRGMIAFWRAKRYVDLQAVDMARAAYVASKLSEVPVGLIPYHPDSRLPKPAPGDCAAVASLLPGRLPRILEGMGWRVTGRYILEDGVALEEITLWAQGLLAVKA